MKFQFKETLKILEKEKEKATKLIETFENSQ
jgi:hypothetical protein